METWQGNPEDTGLWQSLTGTASAVWPGLAGPSPTPPLRVLAVPTRPQPLGPKTVESCEGKATLVLKRIKKHKNK